VTYCTNFRSPGTHSSKQHTAVPGITAHDVVCASFNARFKLRQKSHPQISLWNLMQKHTNSI